MSIRLELFQPCYNSILDYHMQRLKFSELGSAVSWEPRSDLGGIATVVYCLGTESPKVYTFGRGGAR